MVNLAFWSSSLEFLSASKYHSRSQFFQVSGTVKLAAGGHHIVNYNLAWKFLPQFLLGFETKRTIILMRHHGQCVG